MILGLAVLVSAWAVVQSPVLVSAEGTCPAGDDVQAQLAGLLRPLTVNQESARLAREGGVMRIQVMGTQGTVLAERTLPTAGHSCPALAQAAAVVIAAWMIDLHPELAPPAAAQPVSSHAAPPVVTAAPLPREEPHIQAAAGAGTAVSADGWAPEGRLQVGWRAGSRFVLRLSLLGTGRRRVDVDSGSARYALATLAPGIEWIAWGRLRSLSASAWRLGLTADAHATLLRTEGQGFARNVNGVAVEPRAAAGLRLTWQRHNTEVWFAAETRVWIRNQIAAVTPDGSSSSLARWDVGLSFGGAFWR